MHALRDGIPDMCCAFGRLLLDVVFDVSPTASMKLAFEQSSHHDVGSLTHGLWRRPLDAMSQLDFGKFERMASRHHRCLPSGYQQAASAGDFLRYGGYIVDHGLLASDASCVRWHAAL